MEPGASKSELFYRESTLIILEVYFLRYLANTLECVVILSTSHHTWFETPGGNETYHPMEIVGVLKVNNLGDSEVLLLVMHSTNPDRNDLVAFYVKRDVSSGRLFLCF